ncbi:MAG: hypothetical protein KatS3mg062_1250 [Tepidiforma sp.]|nr:MAG: hypothetical protein KatS3mg062_1250 [Tepidiforma sp.]
MSTERPRRRRRIDAPAATLPRPTASEPPSEGSRRQHAPQVRAHHVTKDYSYVKRDLLGILVVGIISFAFIGVMSFVVQ